MHYLCILFVFNYTNIAKLRLTCFIHILPFLDSEFCKRCVTGRFYSIKSVRIRLLNFGYGGGNLNDDYLAGVVLKTFPSARKVVGSNTGPVKTDTVSPPLRCFCVVQDLIRGGGPHYSLVVARFGLIPRV